MTRRKLFDDCHCCGTFERLRTTAAIQTTRAGRAERLCGLCHEGKVEHGMTDYDELSLWSLLRRRGRERDALAGIKPTKPAPVVEQKDEALIELLGERELYTKQIANAMRITEGRARYRLQALEDMGVVVSRKEKVFGFKQRLRYWKATGQPLQEPAPRVPRVVAPRPIYDASSLTRAMR